MKRKKKVRRCGVRCQFACYAGTANPGKVRCWNVNHPRRTASDHLNRVGGPCQAGRKP